MLDAEQEAQVSPAGRVHAEARAEDIGSDGGFRRQPDEDRVVEITFEPVRDRLDVVESRHPSRVRADRRDVDGVARLNLRERPQVIRIHPLEPLDPDIRNPCLDRLLCGHARPPGRVLLLGHGEGRKSIRDEAGRRFTQRDRFGYAREVGGTDVAHRHVDADVAFRQGLELRDLVGFEHHVHAARQQLGGLDQPLRRSGRLDQVHDDHDVRAGLTCDVDGNVTDHSAVGEDVSITGDWRERPGYRHARAHGGGQVTALEDDHLAGDQVGCNGPERNRQLVEIRHHARAGHVAAKQVVDGARVGQPAGCDDLALLETQLDRRARGGLEAFLLDGLQRPAAHAADDGLPIDAGHEFLELGRRQARRVTGADQRAHAGARDAVDRHTLLLEHLEDSHMCAALGAAAGQHEPNARAVRRHVAGTRVGGSRSHLRRQCEQRRTAPIRTPPVLSAYTRATWIPPLRGTGSIVPCIRLEERTRALGGTLHPADI